MHANALEAFVAEVGQVWGPIHSDLVRTVREAMDVLASSDPRQPWIESLLAERPTKRELHRDTCHGFMLLAHAERQGLYRPPHDHGRAWVCYAVQSGELEVGTYAHWDDASGSRLVRRETHVLRPGRARLYLPGDIHDTRCLTDRALVFRFTERDLSLEQGLTRFVDRDGEWTAPAMPA